MSWQKLSSPLIILLIITSFGFHKIIFQLLDKHTNSLSIQSIDITGATLSFDTQMQNIINTATNMSSGKLTSIDINDLKYRLEELDLVKNAIIERNLPHTLTIKIEERKPVAVLKTSTTNYTVDNEGAVLSLIPNMAVPTLTIEYGIAMNGNQIVDDFLLKILAPLVSQKSKNIEFIHIDKNRNIFFNLYNVKPKFALSNNFINDKYILKAQEIGKTLTNTSVKTPKTIDIYSYEDRSIGFY